MSDKKGLIRYDFEAQERFTRAQTAFNVEPKGKPATVEVARGRKLRLLCVSDT